MGLVRYRTFHFMTAIVALLMMTGVARATTISVGTLQVTAADPTQLGRLSRDGNPADWSTSPKPFPGVINATTTYHYTTLDLDLAALETGLQYGGFIQVSYDSTTANTFLSAYLDSYNPLSLSTHYLGDSGFSGDPFPGDPGFFQVIVPGGHHLVLVLNETTGTAAGLNIPMNFVVEAFADTQFTDLVQSQAVPEPASLLMLGSGLAFAIRRRRNAAR